MNQSAIFDQLREALTAYDEFEAIDLPLTEKCIAKHEAGGLVYVTDFADGTAYFMLIHRYVERATEQDVILFDTPFGDLVVQRDVRGYCLAKYLTVKTDSIKLDTDRTGIPLKGRLDSRWDYKVEEVHRLHRIMNYRKKKQ